MSQLIKNGFFGSVPKSPTQMGSLSAKNPSEKFSCLGTFNRKLLSGNCILIDRKTVKNCKFIT
jgi:hypothetical protein